MDVVAVDIVGSQPWPVGEGAAGTAGEAVTADTALRAPQPLLPIVEREGSVLPAVLVLEWRRRRCGAQSERADGLRPPCLQGAAAPASS